MDADLEYLRTRLMEAELVPYQWDGEDKNLGAFRSKKELVRWYCQGPGTEGQPYRDRAFYARELAHVSRVVRPNTIVELGTSLGIGTCLLRWLNPDAGRLVTVDVNDTTFLPGNQRVEMGRLARYQNIKCEYYRMKSWEYAQPGVDLCFVDADHDYAPVLADSHQAFKNRSWWRAWAIVWHDHNERHPGVQQAVAEFCAEGKLELQSRPDSDTVWVWGGVK